MEVFLLSSQNDYDEAEMCVLGLTETVILCFFVCMQKQEIWSTPSSHILLWICPNATTEESLTLAGGQDTGQPASWCLANSEILEKVLRQHAHWYLFISEWVWRWARRLERSAKARLQWKQENGFSPAEVKQTDLWLPGATALNVHWKNIWKFSEVQCIYYRLYVGNVGTLQNFAGGGSTLHH